MQFVAVYGTLRKECSNHDLIARHEPVWTGKIGGFALHNLGAFPYVVHGDGLVFCEVYLLNEAELNSLDRLEGHPTFYRRERMFIYGMQCWIYVWCGGINDGPRIESGDWKKHEMSC